VPVLVVDIKIPVTEDCMAMTSWMTMGDFMGRTLTVMLLTYFKVLCQILFGGTKENHEKVQIWYSGS
jgi:hypothetical protein